MTALDPVVYEIKNNLVSSFSFTSAAIVTYYVLAEHFLAYRVLRSEGLPVWLSVWQSIRWNYNRVRIQLAYSFDAFLFGEYVTTGWTFAIRYLENRGSPQGWMGEEPFIYLPIISGCIQVIAAVCLIRILAPDEWGHRGWVAAALYAIGWSSLWIFWR